MTPACGITPEGEGVGRAARRLYWATASFRRQGQILRASTRKRFLQGTAAKSEVSFSFSL